MQCDICQQKTNSVDAEARGNLTLCPKCQKLIIDRFQPGWHDVALLEDAADYLVNSVYADELAPTIPIYMLASRLEAQQIISSKADSLRRTIHRSAFLATVAHAN
jgi:hypothetical protein